MSIGEILLILMVALVVFGPHHLPKVASHVGQLIARFNKIKQQALVFWEQQQRELQLQDNIRKAHKAEDESLKDLDKD